MNKPLLLAEDAGTNHPSNPYHLTRERRLLVARTIAAADPNSSSGYWVEWIDELKARIAELEQDVDDISILLDREREGVSE